MYQPDVRDRRQYYRLRFPIGFRPPVIVQRGTYRLAELSEGGLVICCPTAWAYHAGQAFRATINLHDGRALPIEGRIIRVRPGEIAVKLHALIPTREIFHEQQFLLRQRQIASA